MVLDASTLSTPVLIRRVLVWVTAIAAVADLVLIGVAVQRHRQLVREISLPALNELDPRFGRGADTEWHERARTIRAESAAMGPNPDWAGDYYQGDGLGENIHVCVAPESGFVFDWTSCTCLNDRNFGTVQTTDGHIALSFQFPNKRERDRGLAAELVPVRWGERRYLIDPDKLERFCADVNSGFEPRDDVHGPCLLRTGDEHKPAPGLPSVPEEYRRLLLTVPVEPTVIEVLGSESQESGLLFTRVALDAGSEQGVYPGMRMGLIEPHESGWLTVENVSARTCTAVVKENVSNGLLPKVGWRFTSRFERR